MVGLTLCGGGETLRSEVEDLFDDGRKRSGPSVG